MKNIENEIIIYPKCSTCKNALKYLKDKNINIKVRDIVEMTPSKEELKIFIHKSGLDIKKWFNTSGLKYKELNFKDKLKDMNEDEKIKLLAGDGMLIKRPILIYNDKIVLGFKNEEYDKII